MPSPEPVVEVKIEEPPVPQVIIPPVNEHNIAEHSVIEMP
jgi:hypothetical protein